MILSDLLGSDALEAYGRRVGAVVDRVVGMIFS